MPAAFSYLQVGPWRAPTHYSSTSTADFTSITLRPR